MVRLPINDLQYLPLSLLWFCLFFVFLSLWSLFRSGASSFPTGGLAGLASEGLGGWLRRALVPVRPPLSSGPLQRCLFFSPSSLNDSDSYRDFFLANFFCILAWLSLQLVMALEFEFCPPSRQCLGRAIYKF